LIPEEAGIRVVGVKFILGLGRQELVEIMMAEFYGVMGAVR